MNDNDNNDNNNNNNFMPTNSINGTILPYHDSNNLFNVDPLSTVMALNHYSNSMMALFSSVTNNQQNDIIENNVPYNIKVNSSQYDFILIFFIIIILV